jgi:HAE1 family hydrophobic/amphiphilic exporter-1
MKIWELSVKRPVFMSCVLVAIVVLGLFSMRKIPLELFPDVAFPIVTIQTVYPGAAPYEIETLVSKPIEDELSGIGGIKVIRSINRESVSVVVAEFELSIDVKYAEQQVRDKVSFAKGKLPKEIEEPIIRRVDPAAQPIMILAIKSPLKDGKLYDLVNETIKPEFEKVNQVGRVQILGGRKREIQILLDREKMVSRQMAATHVAAGLTTAGQNVPAGKIDAKEGELVFRTLGEFANLDQIKKTVVSFFANEALTKVEDVGQVVDTVEDEKVRAYWNGESSAFLYLYKQSGANTMSVSSAIKKRIEKLNIELKSQFGEGYEVALAQDTSKWVADNILDVTEAIVLGIFLTFLVVFLFLGSARSTFITGLAIPVSLIGSLTLLSIFGVSINIMSLLAFSLAVGLLIDDAIVVRENIFRHIEMGKTPINAALDGTKEVGMAVIAVTLAMLAVFGPIAFLAGVVGQFFKSFGLGICFVMIISLFDALSNAPMLSAYFGGKHKSLTGLKPTSSRPVEAILIYFDRLQTKMEDGYSIIMQWILVHRWKTLAMLAVFIVLLFSTVMFIPKTFLAPNESGEFAVGLEMPPGTTLEKMTELALKVDKKIHENDLVVQTLLTVGNENGQSYIAEFFVKLVPFHERTKKTSIVRKEVRELLREFEFAHPVVKDIDMIGAGQRPFVVNIRGQNLDQTKEIAQKLFEKLKTHPGLSDPEITDKPGLPEFQIHINQNKAVAYGVNPMMAGAELRAQVEGIVPVKYRENGIEYDVRVRMRDDERNLEEIYNTLLVPNVNGRMINLSSISEAEKKIGYATINRENRQRYVSIQGDIAAGGSGMGGVIADIDKYFKSGEIVLPEGMSYRFVGQAENFQELGESIMLAAILSIVFIYLVLASLYESIVTPITIMTVIPFAVFGGFFGLFVMQSTLDLFSMIGCIMLMGLATKNSIILVDYINQKIAEGLPMNDAIMAAGRARLRPIVMTTLALVFGMLPVAIGLNEASAQRTSLGIAVVGGVIISTILSLLMIPAVFSVIESMRQWGLKNIAVIFLTQQTDDKH